MIAEGQTNSAGNNWHIFFYHSIGEFAQNLGNIGILGSLDPVAVDQAAIDLTYGAAPNKEIRDRWESTHSTMLTSIAESNGVGKTHYRLIEI